MHPTYVWTLLYQWGQPGSHKEQAKSISVVGSEPYRQCVKKVLQVSEAVSEIKVLFAPTGSTPPETVRPEFSPSPSQYVVIINSSKNVLTPAAHLRKLCTRQRKCTCRAQVAPSISYTVK